MALVKNTMTKAIYTRKYLIGLSFLRIIVCDNGAKVWFQEQLRASIWVLKQKAEKTLGMVWLFWNFKSCTGDKLLQHLLILLKQLYQLGTKYSNI